MKLQIAISPCPNDTYIFEAIFNRCAFVPELEFDFIFEDVQTLNEMAISGKPDIVKISYAHYFSVADHYIMLRSGGAMGQGVGPLLVSLLHTDAEELKDRLIAIPGVNTTANFLLSFAYPTLQNKKPYRFDQIEDAILSKEVSAGVIIHENRFTYQKRGLKLIQDLGKYWELQTGLPVPLGGIAVRRDMPEYLQNEINRLIQNSIEIADRNKSGPGDFIRHHAQEMDEEVMKKHILLYVNEYSKDVGEAGELAIQKMKEVLLPNFSLPILINAK